jgi:hypothetical protein
MGIGLSRSLSLTIVYVWPRHFIGESFREPVGVERILHSLVFVGTRFERVFFVGEDFGNHSASVIVSHLVPVGKGDILVDFLKGVLKIQDVGSMPGQKENVPMMTVTIPPGGVSVTRTPKGLTVEAGDLKVSVDSGLGQIPESEECADEAIFFLIIEVEDVFPHSLTVCHASREGLTMSDNTILCS